MRQIQNKCLNDEGMLIERFHKNIAKYKCEVITMYGQQYTPNPYVGAAPQVQQAILIIFPLLR